MAAPSHDVTDNSGYDYAATVTKSDSTVFDPIPRALWVGGTGDVAVKMASDSSVVIFASVPAGSLLPIRISQVRSTSTTATAMVLVY